MKFFRIRTFIVSLFILAGLFSPFSTSLAGKNLLSTEGRRSVAGLKSSLAKANTTSCRKEQKGVITLSLWEDIHKTLEQGKKGWFGKMEVQPVHLESRDKLPEGGKNGTITFYGEGIKFMNIGVPTKIRLRSRFYLNIFEKEGKKNSDVVRSAPTLNMAFLEIKIKNPTPKEINSVNKYRIMIEDKDLLALFNADPKKDNFKDLIEELKTKALMLKENQKEKLLVGTLFDSIYFLARKNPDFIRPVLAVSYERRGYSFKEENYPLPSRLKNNKDLSKVEYQFTIDQNIRGYLPNLSKFSNDSTYTFEKYFQENLKNPKKSKDLYAYYPQDAVAVEFKDPAPMSNFPLKKKSSTHRFLYEKVVHRMHHPDNMVPGFRQNKGKASHFLSVFKNQNPSSLGGVVAVRTHTHAKILFKLDGTFIFAVKKTPDPKRNGQLELLGGSLDKDETVLEGLIRELKEEDSSGELSRLVEAAGGSPEKIKSFSLFIAPEMTQVFSQEITKAIWAKIVQAAPQNQENSGYRRFSREELALEMENHPKKFTPKTLKFLKKLDLKSLAK